MTLLSIPLRHLRVGARFYSVRAPGGSRTSPKTIADLETWGSDIPNSNIEVCGWVRSVRKSPGIRFVNLTDGSTMRPIQAVIEQSLASEYVTPPTLALKRAQLTRRKDTARQCGLYEGCLAQGR